MTKRPPTTEMHIVLRTIFSAGMLAVLLVLAGAGTAAGATTWVVDDDGGADFVSIQAAVDAASAGDTIEVRSGTYVENVDVGKRLTLVGEGADVVTVRAADAGDHVFEVHANWANISGFTVKGATDWFNSGIYIYNSDHCNISRNNASNNACGIVLWYYSEYNILQSNTANSNNNYGYGIYLSHSNYNILQNNTANLNSRCGISLSESNDNTLTNNRMSDNTYNFDVEVRSSIDYPQNIDTSNTVDGKPIYYWVDQQDKQIPSDAGFVGVVNCTNITVRDLLLKNNYKGVLFAYTENSRIENVTALDNGYGIYLWWSSSNMLQNNNASDNYGGICMDYSSDNTLTNNIANSNNASGIGIWRPCANNTLQSNTASNNNIGIDLNHNVGNTTLYHNNLINNTQYNAWDTGYTNNQWDSGSEGNYYGDDYTGTDSDGDGIGDTPYGISGYSGNGDRYPLMFPYNEQLHETRKEVYSISTSTITTFQVDDDIIDQISTENPDPTVANEKLRACVVSEKEDSSTAAVLDAAETEQQRTDIQNIIDDNSGDFEQTTEEINDYVETSVSDPLGLWDRAKEKFFSTRLPKNTIIDINAANAVTRVFGEFSGAFKKFFWAGKAVTVVADIQTQQEVEQPLDGHAVPSDVSNNLKAVSRISRVITQLDPTDYFSTTINGDLGMLIKVTTKLSDRQVVKPAHYNEEWEYIWDQVDVLLAGTNDVYVDDNGGYARVYENPEDGLHYIYLQGEPKTNFWGKLFGSRETGRWREVEEQYDGTWPAILILKN